jgi:hypothetical protein
VIELVKGTTTETDLISYQQLSPLWEPGSGILEVPEGVELYQIYTPLLYVT